MNVFLWILQIVLAVAFGAAGLTKLSQPKEKLSTTMKWVDDFGYSWTARLPTSSAPSQSSQMMCRPTSGLPH